MISSYRACAKLILLGEHFVVHGAPALAVPVRGVATDIEVHDDEEARRPRLVTTLGPEVQASAERLLDVAADRLGLADRAWRLEVRSDIPVGCGLGSSAALAVALVGALTRAAGRAIVLERVNVEAHVLEKLIHGRPSGIDDTVVTYNAPVVFRRGEDLRFVRAAPGLTFVVASTGASGSTFEAVAGVRRLAERRPSWFGKLLEEAGGLVEDGIDAFEAGDVARLGALMNRNHELLRQVEVSSEPLDRLVGAARDAGAVGAKLTGGGLGGCIVALCRPGQRGALVAALKRAGADPVFTTAQETETGP